MLENSYNIIFTTFSRNLYIARLTSWIFGWQISCDKANVLANSRLWRRVVSEVFEREFPDVELSHQLADSKCLLLFLCLS